VTTGIDKTAATATPRTTADTLIPRTVLFGNPERISPAISPDGRRLAWIAPDDGVLNVWVRDLDGQPGTEHPVTADRDRGVHVFNWAPDGTRILYLQDDAGNENWRLRDVHVDTGEERDLTPGKDSQTRIMKISKRRPGEILLSVNLDRPELHDVYRLDLASGELNKVCENPGFIGFVADEDFRVRAALAPLPDGGTVILVRDTQDSPWRPLLQVDQQDALSTHPLAFSDDGSRLLCITSEGANAAQLVWFDVASGARTVVAGDPTFDVATAALHIDTNQPRVVFLQRDRLTPVVLDPTITDDIATLTALGGDLRLLGSDHADRIWLVATTHDDGPVRYYTYHRDLGEPTFLFAHRPDLEHHTLAPMQAFSVRSRDGLTLHGYLTFPPGTPRRDLPAVLLVHGGPWHRDCWGLDPQAQWLASRGYVVVQVNFRGSTGYGKDFLNAGNREWGAKMHDDLLDALNWTVGQGWVDPARVAIFGSSYGGYAALVGAAFTPEVFRCAVAVAAPANLNTLITSYPPYWKPMIVQAHLRVGNPETEPDFLWSRSPLSRVADIRIPVMIVQGANDPRVPQADSEQIVAALREHDVPLSYLLYPDEGHGLVKPDNRLRFHAAAEHFLAQHLGGRAEVSDETASPDAAPPTH
jgi:dipeptidyl aminopeptidase/acylaminoacyl peptidase